MDFLRQQNLFGNGLVKNPYEGIFGEGMNPPNTDIPMLRGMNGVFGARPLVPDETQPDEFQMPTFEHEASDRFSQLANSYPERNKPGILRRIGAIAAGIGGSPELADRIAHKPYYEAVEDWKAKIGPAQEAANLERYSNANERQLAYNIGQLRASNKRLDETNRHNLETEETSRLRAQAYDFAQRNPNHIIKQYGDGYVRAVDPKTNEVVNLGKWAMSEADKINLQHQNRLGEIEATGGQARQTRAVIPGGSRSNASLPSQAKIAAFNAASQFVRENPALGKYVNLDPTTSTFTLADPRDETDWFPGGPTADEYATINNYISANMGKYKLPPKDEATPQTPQAPKGFKYVPKMKDGKQVGWTAVPEIK